MRSLSLPDLRTPKPVGAHAGIYLLDISDLDHIGVMGCYGHSWTFAGMGTQSNGNGGRPGRLKSWKEIAAFFGTNERTVRRWAAGRGLPVSRVPGGRHSTVYAEVAELEHWMRSARVPRDAEPAGPTVRSGRTWRGRAIAVACLALLLAGSAAVGLYGRDLLGRTELSRHQPSRKALNLYLAATYQWERRTEPSLRRAIDLYGQAIAEDPAYAEAFAGLANAYLLMREYSDMPDAEAYPRALAAAERALSLDDRLPEAHTATAFVAFYWTWDFDKGLREFERAIALDPRSAHAHHWYATALLHIGDVDRALEQINAAQRLDPASHAILADKGLVLLLMGRKSEAVVLLRQVAAAKPDFLSPHVYLANFYLARGEYRAWLDEARIVARLSDNQAKEILLENFERAFDAGGGAAMLRSILDSQKQPTLRPKATPFDLAGTYALIGDRDAALRHLQMAVEARDPAVLGLPVDPTFDGLRDEPAFQNLRARIGLPAA